MSDYNRIDINDKFSILNGDCLDVLKTLPDSSVDSICTDPPAGIAFAGSDWDKDKGGREEWVAWMQKIASECYRVTRAGGYALVWAIPRTSHWTAMAWEEAGWVCDDVVSHIFGSGFPKSLDVSKAIDKLKGAVRPVIGTKKGVRGADGTGHESSAPAALACVKKVAIEIPVTAAATPEAAQWAGWGTTLKPASEHWILLHKPSEGGVEEDQFIDDKSRFCYCAKASQADRHEGFPRANEDAESGNLHPTVKNLALMIFLIRVVTRQGGVVLDPFMGSGSTGKACAVDGFGFVGVELSPEYFRVAEARIRYAIKNGTVIKKECAAEEDDGQLDLL
jgi:site-specific DNA-methyltransferase (adenine-specific)